jgi:RNA polymerase sigma-70 factor, ECF subfamily
VKYALPQKAAFTWITSTFTSFFFITTSDPSSLPLIENVRVFLPPRAAGFISRLPMKADLTLLNSAREMNGDALAKIFDLYAPALYHYALRTGRDPLMADHIVGDVFARLLEKLSSGNGPTANLRSYLFETAYHLIVDGVRYSQSRSPLDGVDSLQYDGRSLTVGLEKRLLFERVSCAIGNDLTESQRHVIILRFLEGFNLHETAAILGKSVNLVKVTQNRAIKALRKALCQEDDI